MSGFIEDAFIEKNKDRFASILKKPFSPDEVSLIVKKCIEIEIEENKFIDDIPIAFCEKPFEIPGIQDDLIQFLLDVKIGSQLRNLLSELKVQGKDSFNIDHVGKIINVAMALYEKLDWKTDKIFEKIVLASYLHDHSIKSKPELIKYKSLEEIDANQVSLGVQNYFTVFNHPEKSYSTLANLDNIHLDVLSMVRYHHEQPNGKGFPNKIQYTKLNALVSLFIAAHDFVNYCEESSKVDIEDFINKKSEVYTGPIFKKILKAFYQLAND
jgi:response regulator RpfG family c-di-GMP phosphodiesterase